MEAARLAVVFALIVLALRRKVPVGITLLGAGVVAALLYGVEIPVLLRGYADLLQSGRFLFLTSVVVLITILGTLLEQMGYLRRLSAACRGMPGGARTAAMVLPPLVGMMPMPGGSLLSAPLVDNVLADSQVAPELRTVTNYWFRHIVEFSWPLYPGIILTEAITGIPLGTVAMMQLPMSVIMALIGILFFARKLGAFETEAVAWSRIIFEVAATVWPIALAIAIYAVFHLELAWAVLVAIGVLLIRERPSLDSLKTALKKGFSLNLLVLVLGALSFQTVLELSGGIESIPRLATSLNLPPELVIFLVCFVTGLLTGMVAGYVALGYTLLAGMLYQPELMPSRILLAYLSGYLGIMLSPTHLCLVLTNDYFKSDLAAVYRKLLLPLGLLAVVGLLLYLSGWCEYVVLG